MDPPQPVPGMGDHMLLRDLTPDGRSTTSSRSAGAGSASPLLSVEFRHLGGALGRVEPGAGATASIEAEFAMFAVGMTMDPVMAAAVGAYLPVVKQALAPLGQRPRVPQLRRSTAPMCAAHVAVDVYQRLRQVKTRVRPADIFRSNHPVPPAR